MKQRIISLEIHDSQAEYGHQLDLQTMIYREEVL